MNNSDWIQTQQEAVEYLRPFIPEGRYTGVVLGTGLGGFSTEMSIEYTIPYTNIPGFPTATVEFHKGNLLVGHVDEKPVVAMQGRFHFYEGYTMQQITFPIRVLKALGVHQLLMSNAAGGINKNFMKGDLVLLEDHINFQTDNPLRGMNDAAFGARFPDMSAPYSKSLMKVLSSCAEDNDCFMKKGVYASVIGPNLETRAEYRFLRIIGADMVGMSTVPEVIVANQLGVPCAVVSVITDECDPETLKAVDISEIIAVAGKADEKLSKIFADTIREIG